ncbi:MAG: DNA recombination/repair protein RecA, partial [Clostridia bacterium]
MDKSSKSDKDEKANKNMTKEELIADAIAKIEKQYGKGSIMRLGDTEIMPIEVISSGILP